MSDDGWCCFPIISDVSSIKRYREDKRFALQTRGAVASAVDAMQLDAIEAAKRLTTFTC